MKIIENFQIAGLTTFKIGGKVRYFFQPATSQEILEAIIFLKEKKLPYFVLGEGSNVIIGSKDYEGGVISMLQMNKIRIFDSAIICESGVINSNLSLFASKNNIKDFEFLFKMPGSIGGSTVMNARAFGTSMSDVILEVKAINSKLELVTYNPDKISFGYKKSLFQNKGYIIAEVIFKAEGGELSEIKEKMASNEKKRLQTKQYDFPSAGCIFKNNYNLGVPSGQIIDELGLKGERIGDAEIYQNHANFIINKGNATSDDVLELIRKIKSKAKSEKQVDLECEVQFLGQF